MNLEQILSTIKNYNPTILGKNFRTYSILIPLIMKNDKIHVLFEVRSMKLRRQPGEICFPGGRVEKSDASPKEAAIRETSEELGIKKEEVNHVYPIDYFVHSMEERIIYPFVGMINPEKIEPNPNEVKEIFTVPLDFLKEQEPEKHPLQFQIAENPNFPFHLIPGGKNYPFQTHAITEYFYFYEDYVIWGLTAKILHHFLSIIDQK